MKYIMSFRPLGNEKDTSQLVHYLVQFSINLMINTKSILFTYHKGRGNFLLSFFLFERTRSRTGYHSSIYKQFTLTISYVSHSLFYM